MIRGVNLTPHSLWAVHVVDVLVLVLVVAGSFVVGLLMSPRARSNRERLRRRRRSERTLARRLRTW